MRQRPGQSTAEYAILFSVVIAALVGMQLYMKRGGQARLKIGIDEYTKVGFEPRPWLKDSTPPTDFKIAHTHEQYEPYYNKSDMTTMSASETADTTDLTTHTVTHTIAKGKELNVRKKDSFQSQAKPNEAD